MFSALSRAESLSGLPNSQHDIIKLADLGLYNPSHLTFEFKHVFNPEITLDSDKIINSSANELVLSLEDVLPNNRLLNSLPSPSVDIVTSLNNLPPQICKSKIEKVLINDSLPIVVTVHENAQISLWNANKALVHLTNANFLDSFDPKRPKMFKKPAPKPVAQPNQPQGNFFGGFGMMNPIAAEPNSGFQEPKELDEDNDQEPEKAPQAEPPGQFPGGFGPPGGFGGGGFGGGFGG